MTYTTSKVRWGPEFTPTAIKKLILITVVATLVSSLLNPIFTRIFGIPGPEEWLSLSWWGISHYLMWQPVTYLFVQHTGYYGITLFFLIHLVFNMYIIWVMGTDILHRVGQNPFLRLYFICGVLAGLTALLTMSLTGQYSVLSGATPAILAILVVWSMFCPETELLIFFVFPVKAKWLIAGILGIIFLTNLSQGNLLSLSFYLSGAVYGYFYALLAWGLQSPFSVTHRFDGSISRFGQKLLRFKPEGKIIDFKTGKSKMSDEQFVDAMLAKISKYGEDPLTWRERRRMQKISEEKKKKSK